MKVEVTEEMLYRDKQRIKEFLTHDLAIRYIRQKILEYAKTFNIKVVTEYLGVSFEDVNDIKLYEYTTIKELE